MILGYLAYCNSQWSRETLSKAWHGKEEVENSQS